jgi:GNAT superfamily N-acetyltransferase
LLHHVPVDSLSIRQAAARDVERIAQIIHGEPGDESVALTGSVDRARRFGYGLVNLDAIPNAARPTVVAESDGRVVGVLQYTRGQSGTPITLGHVRLAVSVMGPIGVLRLLPRLRARTKVDMPIPVDSFYVAELHVDPKLRGQGVGGQLLDWAEQEATRLGDTRMTLTTTATNPARHLYERKGFTVTRSATDPSYERFTGIPGRVLMEKRTS